MKFKISLKVTLRVHNKSDNLIDFGNNNKKNKTRFPKYYQITDPQGRN